MSVAPQTAKQAQGARSREDILDAAERLMGTRGYAATSISTLAKASGLPASSIYWHFGSKSGILGAVMERGSRRFFAATERGRLDDAAEPEERLRQLLELSAASIGEHPQFLRLFLALLLRAEGEHAQQEVVDRVRAEGRRRLISGLVWAYQPWGEEVAERVGAELGDLAIALFDGLFVATETLGSTPAALVARSVEALHALAEQIRARG
jgi:AcrR family transcriptional regulator